LLLVSLAAPVQALPQSVEAMVAGSRCEAAVRHQLAAWGGELDGALPDAPDPGGTRTVRVPTGALGVWLRLVVPRPREVAVERVTATRIERVSFDRACVAGDPAAVASAPAAAHGFGDSDLIVRLARGDRGVFLLWSPHMPLSVDQHAVLAGVARDLGLAVVPLLDPGADLGYAARVARERDLPAEAVRPLNGIELAFRGMTTHPPSLQLFAGGRLVGPVLRGYRSAEALRETLEVTLGGR
jgi:hypothetical protein